jgi:Fe-S-cluster containining protein
VRFAGKPDIRAETLAEVRVIYREVDAMAPLRDCRRLTQCCRFRLTGRTPQLTAGEALVAAHALRASGRKSLPEARGGDCPLLREDGRCLIYQDRPFGCRTHFCAAAGGPYPRAQVLPLIRRLEAIDAQLQGDGPRSLTGAIMTALRIG